MASSTSNRTPARVAGRRIYVETSGQLPCRLRGTWPALSRAAEALMIQVVRQGRAWAVVRDGVLVRRGAAAAVYKTYQEALASASLFADQFGEPLVIPAPEPPRSAEVIPHPAMFRRRPHP